MDGRLGGIERAPRKMDWKLRARGILVRLGMVLCGEREGRGFCIEFTRDLEFVNLMQKLQLPSQLFLERDTPRF
jgi:hypothetical protein